MIRCSTVANTARSTGNSKPRPRSRSAMTARQPVSSHSRPNRRGAPMRLQARPSGLPASSWDNEGALGVAGDGASQALEGAGGGDGLLASEVLDDALPGTAALAHGLGESAPHLGGKIRLELDGRGTTGSPVQIR